MNDAYVNNTYMTYNLLVCICSVIDGENKGFDLGRNKFYNINNLSMIVFFVY
jgi:hypothetical protein